MPDLKLRGCFRCSIQCPACKPHKLAFAVDGICKIYGFKSQRACRLSHENCRHWFQKRAMMYRSGGVSTRLRQLVYKQSRWRRWGCRLPSLLILFWQTVQRTLRTSPLYRKTQSSHGCQKFSSGRQVLWKKCVSLLHNVRWLCLHKVNTKRFDCKLILVRIHVILLFTRNKQSKLPAERHWWTLPLYRQTGETARCQL